MTYIQGTVLLSALSGHVRAGGRSLVIMWAFGASRGCHSFDWKAPIGVPTLHEFARCSSRDDKLLSIAVEL
jgi:hypothetical protein